MSYIKSLINNLVNERSAEAELDLHNHIRDIMRSKLNESYSDAVSDKVEQLLNQVQRKGVNAMLSDEELDNSPSDGNDKQIVKFFLSKRIDGIEGLKVERITGDDDLSGVKFTFKVGGKSYEGSWYPEAGQIMCMPVK